MIEDRVDGDESAGNAGEQVSVDVRHIHEQYKRRASDVLTKLARLARGTPGVAAAIRRRQSSWRTPLHVWRELQQRLARKPRALLALPIASRRPTDPTSGRSVAHLWLTPEASAMVSCLCSFVTIGEWSW